MLKARYYGVPVIFRSTWDSEDEAASKRARGLRPISWRDGRLVENVKVMDPVSGEVADWTLGEHMNGEIVVGQTYDLDVETVIEKDGNRTKYRHRVVGAELVKAPPVKAAA